MIKFTSTMALLAGAMMMVGAGLAACTSNDGVVVAGALQGSGSVRLALEAGGQMVSTVTAVISGKKGFVTQTHAIDVSGANSVISIYFGNLPVGDDYEIELTAGPCIGTAQFDVTANETTLVNVDLLCGPDRSEDNTGAVQITGTLKPGAARECFHILKMVAAPSVQSGATGPVSQVEVVLNDWVKPSTISWSTASTNGGAGTIAEMTGNVDSKVTFDCSATGTVAVIANVTAPNEDAPCTEQGRVNVECLSQGTTPPRCGDGVINQTSEQCDGAAIPAGQPAGTTCNASCILVPPSGGGPRCGDNIINQTSEQCDGTAIPAGQPAGTTCNGSCILVPPTGTLGPCLTCAQAKCPTQYANAVGSASSATNLAEVTQLFDCVIGPNWEQGNAIPANSCFFGYPTQPGGSLLPCYCGNTPQATCVATGPANNADACGLEVELASDCAAPVSASCVTASGSSPEVPLGDALQLLNCERAACQAECGFPPPAEE